MGSGTKAKFLQVPLVRVSGTKAKYLQVPQCVVLVKGEIFTSPTLRCTGRKAKLLQVPHLRSSGTKA